jgi:hypothetical protein
MRHGKVSVFLLALLVTGIASAGEHHRNLGAIQRHRSLRQRQTFSSNGSADADLRRAARASRVTRSTTRSSPTHDSAPLQPETFTIVVTGSVSGTPSGQFVDPEGGRSVPLTGSVSANSISLSFPGNPTTSGTFTLSLVSSTPPDSRLTGTYTGPYDAVIVPCGNPPGVAYSGTATAGLIQAGTAISGSFTISNAKEDVCNTPGSRTVIDAGSETVLFSGQVNGSSITGSLCP